MMMLSCVFSRATARDASLSIDANRRPKATGTRVEPLGPKFPQDGSVIRGPCVDTNTCQAPAIGRQWSTFPPDGLFGSGSAGLEGTPSLALGPDPSVRAAALASLMGIDSRIDAPLQHFAVTAYRRDPAVTGGLLDRAAARQVRGAPRLCSSL